MKTGHHDLLIASGGQRLPARLIAGAKGTDANGASVLFVHGWDSDHQHYEDLSEDVAALGFACMSFDLRGHGPDIAEQDDVSRADNLDDVLAAYDALAGWPGADAQKIVIIGTSYGGYLSTIASALRPVRSIALRVPALYPDAQWDTPKSALSRPMLHHYRNVRHTSGSNRALRACQAFEGDVLVITSEQDEVLAPPSVQSFVDAFGSARSLQAHRIAGADHALSDPTCRAQYAAILLSWLRSQVRGGVELTGIRHAA